MLSVVNDDAAVADGRSMLDELCREGARRMLAAALEAENAAKITDDKASAEEAVAIVVRHLRERVTISELPDLPREVPAIWLRQITDKSGFEIIYVAALRSVGIPARLGPDGRAEFWNADKWTTAPPPSIINW